MQKIDDGLTREQRYALRHPERRRASYKRWRENHVEHTRQWRKKNYAQNAERVRLYNARIRYGVTPERYAAMLSEQNNKCAICDVDFSTLKRRPAIDHDHATGKVRALLCNVCNVRVGVVENEHKWRDGILAYLASKKDS